MLRQLIVNADDLGLSTAVNQGILEAHLNGIVTSTSLMVNMPAAEESVAMVLEQAPELGVGLHINFTAGVPCSPVEQVPDLVTGAGVFRPEKEQVVNLYSVDPGQLRAELSAQLRRFEELVGRPPDHLDSHHHITYLNPGAVALMAEAALDLGVPIRKAIPDRATALATVVELGLAADESQAAGRVDELLSAVSTTNVLMPDRFIAEFFGQRATMGDLLNLLVDTQEGVTELMCHPAVADESLKAVSGYADRRADELAILIHPTVREFIHSQFIQLVSFSAVGSQGGA
jgi:chitin disaccharide deacetylase